MASLCISCIILLSILLQRVCCEQKVRSTLSFTGFVGFYFPDLPLRASRRVTTMRNILSALMEREWKDVAPSTCLSLHLYDNCTGYVLADTNPPSVEIEYIWRRPKPFSYCKFHHQDDEANSSVLIFSHFTDNDAVQIITFIDRLCINLPMHLEVTSVEKSGVNECMELYWRVDCLGEFYELSESTPNSIPVALNKIVMSYKPCNPETFVTPIMETDKNEPESPNGNLGERELSISVSGSSSNLVLALFGLLSLILLLLVSAFIFGVFYLRRRFFPHLYEAPILSEQLQLANVQQRMCQHQRPTQGIYGPVLQPQRVDDLLA